MIGLTSATQEIIFVIGANIYFPNQYDFRRLKWVYVKTNLPNVNRLCESVDTYYSNILDIITIDQPSGSAINYKDYDDSGWITIPASAIKNGFTVWIEDEDDTKIEYMDYFLEISIKH